MASASESSPTFPALRRQIASGRLKPVYLLHGEEGYYIDELVKDFENLVPEGERDFNLSVLYALEAGPEGAAEAAMAYPFMSERRVVILKECQSIRADSLNKLHHYCEHPSETSVLVIVCRGEKSKAKELNDAVRKSGVIFESKRLTDRTILPAISDLIKEKQLNVEPKALSMLRDFIGTDLSRLYNEIGKLAFILGPGSMVTPEAIERNIGISKDFNNFELIDAVNRRDAARIFRIADYFAANPKNNPAQVTAAMLFNHFSNLLVYLYTRDKTDAGYMAALGLKSPWQLRNYQEGARCYNASQVIEIISEIRRFDCRSKGIGSKQDEYSLLRDLLFSIITATGRIEVLQ